MTKYSWALDGYGRQYICLYSPSSTEILLCVLPGASVYDCMDLLDYVHA